MYRAYLEHDELEIEIETVEGEGEAQPWWRDASLMRDI